VSRYSLGHVSDHALKLDLIAHAVRERECMAAFVARIAEFRARKLYVPAGYSSMYAYCIHELHLSEQAAYKRIFAAKAARRFPEIFEALADGRLSLTAVVLLARHLTQDNVGELLAAASHRTTREIEALLAERFPSPDLPTRIVELSPPAPMMNIEPAAISENCSSNGSSLESATHSMTPNRPSAASVQELSGRLSARKVDEPSAPARVTPLAPGRFGMQVTITQEARDLLRHAQELLGYDVRLDDVAQVIELALAELVRALEKRKFCATENPRRGSARPLEGSRYVPSAVKRRVWERDGGQCTFVNGTGQRCPERASIEFDHRRELARGGLATVDNVRLLCRAHNQYAAEQTFGGEFMRNKRHSAVEARKQTRAG
jgi:5-methylcytosine-specific restriction endonuclease McrA